MTDYEVDLDTLEDMCSELSEECVLFDTNKRIIWSNKSASTTSYDSRNAASLWIDEKLTAFVSEVFLNGKLMRYADPSANITLIPIRHDAGIGYVLGIIERSTRHDLLIDFFMSSTTQAAVLFDDQMHYVTHNGALTASFSKASSLLTILIDRIKQETLKSKDVMDRNHMSAKALEKLCSELVGESHEVRMNPLKIEKRISGYMMVFSRRKK